MNKFSLKKKHSQNRKKKTARRIKNRKKNISYGGTLLNQMSSFENDLNFKRFDCRQPFWDSSCI